MNDKMVHDILCAIGEAVGRMSKKTRDMKTKDTESADMESADMEGLLRICGEIDGLLRAHRIILNALSKEVK